ncbi:uncharacterized protein LAESUDRAFT_103512 [Laetiporus sulphureus 93-53]|uniref:Uncharacterized protein n=1 Tax=Laetiporus sulphureus 93-53 TaxID=1314785 RepID=A0A165ETD4_9APHY|nr:uncharacterized protein LAESUDRAFT_103512 [Laetiporus sulphureus 93-53]KZT07717.1 hypothetical protein LAESUDRAFT_103512 [Laetiporus sulphureus 93-53]
MRGSTGLLLSVLVLVVLRVAGCIVLRLLVVSGPLAVAGLAAPLLRRSTAVPVTITAVWRLRWAIAAAALLGNHVAALPDFRTAPWRDVRTTRGNVVSCRPSPWRRSTTPTWTFTSLPKLRHQAGIFGVEPALHNRRRSAKDGVRIPVNSAIPGHVTSTSADTTDDIGCEVTLLRTVVLPVTDTAAILADLVLVIAQRSV